MADRPKRDRKPPERFEPLTPTSTVAVVGRPARIKKGKQCTRQPSIKNERYSPNQRPLAPSKRGRNGGRDHRSVSWRGHGQHQQPHAKQSDVNRDDLSMFGTDGDEELDLLPSPFQDGKENGLIGSDIDFDHNDDNSNLGHQPRNRRSKSVQEIPYFRTEDDATIEQFYADPYERLDPVQPAYDEWRRQNLEKALLEQGWHINRTKATVNWLMQQTTPKPLQDPGKYIRRLAKPKFQKDDEIPDENDAEPFPIRHNGGLEELRGHVFSKTPESMAASVGGHIDLKGLRGGHVKHQDESSEPLKAFCVLPDDYETSRSDQDSNAQREHTSDDSATDIQYATSAFHDTKFSKTNAASLGETEVDRRIKALKAALKRFEIVYGDSLPDPNYADYMIDHYSRQTVLPRSMRTTGFMTQGHGPLHEVKIASCSQALRNHLIEPKSFNTIKSLPNRGLFHNQSEQHSPLVLTEDPHFGLNPLPKSQYCTQSERRLVRLQAERHKLEAEEELVDRRAQEAEENEDERVQVQAQLRRKVFEWEDERFLSGEWATEKGDMGCPWQHIYEVGEDDSRWKEIRERQAIIVEGGQRAADLMLEDERKAKAEAELDKRRQERARARDRKRARIMGCEDGDSLVQNGPLANWSIDDE